MLLPWSPRASTPNSLDEDYDDFKSADSKPSDSSQFTSSNSENEDFRMFESYLDDFDKYAALRSLESIGDTTPSVTDNGKIIEEEEDSWADFQTVE
ncbi:hypothetical protein KUTeg_009728 [Tegillarca granosa]|uniref:Uncharacterized protein n=1 Tax=Tegillarca granosa TaxID=220873 RepID=A0ABQ9F7U8_TEGGR|nr:hypothetical protein KUTeg_009728 [Tegillarca granosa]